MKLKLTDEDILREPYLCKAWIQRLLHIRPREAEKVFQIANKIDDEELGQWRISEKVRIETVMKVTGKDIELLKEQIKMRTP